MSTSARILVTTDLPGDALEVLRQVHEVVMIPEGQTIIDWMDSLEQFDGLVCLLTDVISSDVIQRGNRLKVISNVAVGYNNIDVRAARQRGITVCNTPGVLTDSTADLTLALLLACARHVVAGDQIVRQGHFHGWDPKMLLGMELRGKTLGIVGCGRIGLAVAQRAAAFGMNVVYSNRNQLSDTIEQQYQLRYLSLEELLKQSDVVSLHAPLTDETYHIISDQTLTLMKPESILMNTARGPLIDEEALARALQEKRIAVAGLDVYEFEPNVHPQLLELDNVVLLPHIGSATWETRSKMARMAIDNCLAVLAGEKPLSEVTL